MCSESFYIRNNFGRKLFQMQKLQLCNPLRIKKHFFLYARHIIVFCIKPLVFYTGHVNLSKEERIVTHAAFYLWKLKKKLSTGTFGVTIRICKTYQLYVQGPPLELTHTRVVFHNIVSRDLGQYVHLARARRTATICIDQLHHDLLLLIQYSRIRREK